LLSALTTLVTARESPSLLPPSERGLTGIPLSSRGKAWGSSTQPWVLEGVAWAVTPGWVASSPLVILGGITCEPERLGSLPPLLVLAIVPRGVRRLAGCSPSLTLAPTLLWVEDLHMPRGCPSGGGRPRLPRGRCSSCWASSSLARLACSCLTGAVEREELATELLEEWPCGLTCGEETWLERTALVRPSDSVPRGCNPAAPKTRSAKRAASVVMTVRSSAARRSARRPARRSASAAVCSGAGSSPTAPGGKGGPVSSCRGGVSGGLGTSPFGDGIAAQGPGLTQN